MPKKALVLVQGISRSSYIKKDIEKFKSEFSGYDLIKVAPTESIFDKSIISKISDRFGDVVQYFKSHNQRKLACTVVRNQIRTLQNDGYEVDVLAHSLGTLMTLTCGGLDGSKNPLVEVNKVMLFACPLGMKVPGMPIGLYVRNHTRKYIQNFKAKEIQYTWSKRDFVSASWSKAIKDILLLASPNVQSLELDCDHALEHYLGDLYS